jgi:hypothetical protein
MKTKLLITAATFLLIVLGNVTASSETQQLPISSFLNAIGPTGIVSWNDPVSGKWLFFDMFGKRAEFFGLNFDSSFSGNITVRDLGDGAERVTITLHTRNAACWGAVTDAGGAQLLAFGQLPGAIAGGANASLGDGLLRIVFLQPQGSPIPRYGQIFAPPRQLEFLATEITCQNGELRGASGYPDGTPGLARTTQIWVADTGVPAGCPPEQDGNCFPAELVDFRPVGNGQ